MSEPQSERTRMLQGELYIAGDPELVVARVRARHLCAQFNSSDPADVAVRTALLQTQLGPNVQLLTADHPRDATLRASGRELARAIDIGARTWLACIGWRFVSLGRTLRVGWCPRESSGKSLRGFTF